MLMTISPLQYPARLMQHSPKLPNLYKIDQLKRNYYNFEMILMIVLMRAMMILIVVLTMIKRF